MYTWINVVLDILQSTARKKDYMEEKQPNNSGHSHKDIKNTIDYDKESHIKPNKRTFNCI